MRRNIENIALVIVWLCRQRTIRKRFAYDFVSPPRGGPTPTYICSYGFRIADSETEPEPEPEPNATQ